MRPRGGGTFSQSQYGLAGKLALEYLQSLLFHFTREENLETNHLYGIPKLSFSLYICFFAAPAWLSRVDLGSAGHVLYNPVPAESGHELDLPQVRPSKRPDRAQFVPAPDPWARSVQHRVPSRARIACHRSPTRSPSLRLRVFGADE